MILIVGQNSVLQKTNILDPLHMGEVNRVRTLKVSAGGKGANTLRALQCIQGRGLVMAYAGGTNRKAYRDYLKKDKLPRKIIPIQQQTRICFTLVEKEDGITKQVTEIIEPSPAINAKERRLFITSYEKLLRTAEMVVIAGTAMQGELSGCYAEYIKLAHQRRIPVLLDAHKSQGIHALSASPDIVKVNQFELGEITQHPVESVEERKEACRQLVKDYAAVWVIISLGADGAEAYDGNEYFSLDAPKLDVTNAVGSGDSFNAGVCAYLQREKSTKNNFPGNAQLHQAVTWGIAAGSANCLTLIPGEFLFEEFKHFLGTASQP